VGRDGINIAGIRSDSQYIRSSTQVTTDLKIMPTLSAKGRRGVAGRGKAKGKAPPTRESTPFTQGDVSASEDENQQPTDPLEKSPQQGTAADVLPMKRKKAEPLNLTREQEVSVIEWLKDHPELFDKCDDSYKDSAKKKALWKAKAEELGQESGVLLLTWYRSMRIRYGKLQKTTTKSGAGSSQQLSHRDHWILDNFSFFKPHIYVCPKRATGLVSIISDICPLS
jgi:hypothetical protein